MWQDLVEDIRKRDIILTLENDRIINPSVSIMMDAAQILLKICNNFGFNPRARMSLKINPQAKGRTEF
ncbi:MAG: P27 family phage terminase small subunit [Saprospiraceae bacterium]|nr:P27 family phage terminase small subunit [Saprospiraceae bacterium]